MVLHIIKLDWKAQVRWIELIYVHWFLVEALQVVYNIGHKTINTHNWYWFNGMDSKLKKYWKKSEIKGDVHLTEPTVSKSPKHIRLLPSLHVKRSKNW